jgi:hypothetical protein
MVDLQSILAEHRPLKKAASNIDNHDNRNMAEISEIPDLFFDQILVTFKLSRIEIMVLMYLYRKVWCRPNIHKEYGISPLMSHTEMAKSLGQVIEEIYNALRRLEDYSLISTVRSGQYFVRKYFLKENDERYLQTYDDFEV